MIRVHSCLNRWLTSLVLFSLVLGPLSVPGQVSASQRVAAPIARTSTLSPSDLAVTAGDTHYTMLDRIDIAPVVQPDAQIIISVVVEPSRLPADGESQAAVLIYVTDADRLPVQDGTPITVKTTAGRLSAEEGKTEGGLLRLTLTAPDKPTEGTITAFAGGAKGEAVFTAGGAAVTDGGVVPGAVAEAAQRARNRLQPDRDGRWTAQNKRYAATFDETGLALNLKQDDADEKARYDAAGGIRLSYRLENVTLGGETLYRHGDRSNAPRIADNVARYERASILEEEYTARDRGVQQTFTLWEALPGVEGDLVIRGFLDTPLEAELLSREKGVLFYLPNRQDDSIGERAGQERAGPVLRYSGALVHDIAGREIWADLALDGNRLTLSVPGAWLVEAAYPVVIDPMIGDPALVSDPRDEQGELDVAYNESGNEYLVVWSGYDTGGADADIVAQRVDADGTLLGNLIVIAQATGDQIWPAVAYNSDLDEYLVVWTDYRDDMDGDVYGQRVDADGTLLGSALLIGDTETLQDRPDVAYNPNDGVYLAVWRDRRGPSVYVYGQVIAANGILSGTNLIIYNKTGNNYFPRVAYNSMVNEFLVVWSLWWNDIYGQRVSGLGELLDNPGTPEDESDPAVAFIISDSGVDQCYPAVAANDVNGNYLVIWADSRNDSSDIYGRVVSSTGAPVGTDFSITTNASDYQANPDLAYDGVNDVYLAVWRDDRGSDQDNYGQIISFTGALSGTNFVVDDSTGTQYYPEAAANTTSGGFLSAWLDWRNNTSNVYGRLVAESGQTQGGSFAIGPVTGQKYYPSAAFNAATNEYLVVWEDYRDGNADIYGQRLDQDGVPSGDNFRISEASTAAQQHPRVTSAGAAGYLVVWEDRRADGNGDIYGQRVAVDGTLLGNNVLVAATGEKQSEARLAYNSDDAVYLVVWRDMRADGYGDIYGQMISSGGVLSGSNFVVSAYGGRTQKDPAVVYNDFSGEFLVAWSQWQSSGNYDIYAQRLSGGGVLLDNSGTPEDESQADVSFIVCAAGGSQYEPQITAAANGIYLVVWYDRRSYATSSDDVYGQMIAPDGSLSGGDIVLSTASGQQRMPMIAALPGEAGFVAVWNDMRSGYDLYGQRVSLAGAPVGQAELLADEVSWLDGLSLAAHTARPEAMVTWEESGNIYAQRYSVLMADFSATPRFGSAPLTVDFADLSSPATEITTYFWDFGDGETSAAISPTHTYTQSGIYTVTLTVSGTSGAHTAVKPGYVTVNSDFTPETDLRGYWRLEGGAGMQVDLSGYNNHLTSKGSVQGVEQGYLGGAVDLENSSTAYLSIDHGIQNGLDITGSLTLIGWVKPESYHSNYTMMVAKYQLYDHGQYENAGYRFGLTDQGKLHLLVSPDGTSYGGNGTLEGAAVIPIGQWTHVAAVFDAQAREMRLYVNGVLDASRTVNFSQVHVSTAPFMMGADVDVNSNATQQFDGILDEWRVYARALSQNEIQEVLGLPGANFVAAPAQGFAPLVVTFTNTSVNATSYLWDFGDGSAASTQVNPVHTYLQPGAYTVTLQAGDGVVTDTLVRVSYVQATDIAQDLRGYWPLNETSGTRYDTSGRDNHLSDYNTVGSAAGVMGLGADFEVDNSEYLAIGHGVQSGLDITGSLSLVGWVKPERVDQYQMLAAKYEYGAANRGYRFEIRPTGKLCLIVSPDGQSSSSYQLEVNANLTAGQWYHVAGVFDAQARTMSIYVNGTLAGTRSVNYDHIYHSTAPFMLGADVYNGSPIQYLDGVLDEWRVYARALSGNEVQGLMNIQPPTADFSATPTSGNAPLTVTFTNLSVNATSYEWDFGDGVTSTEENPTHTYATAGVYTVTLTASGPGGSDTEIKAGHIVVGGQTEAVIDPQSGGTLSSVDGRVRLDFPPGAVTESMTVTMFISETNAYTVGQTAPLVLFSLEAEGHPEVEFAVPITLTMNLSDLIDHRDLMTWEHVSLATQVTIGELPTQTFWVEVPLYRSEVTGTYVAQIEHFSTWMGGVGGQEYAGWKLAYNAPSVDTFSGAATYNYPLDLPPGRGGLTPAVNLSYNSKRVDGTLSWTESDWVGRGWSIDAVEIARQGVRYCWDGNPDWICYDNRFTLLINGTGHDLYPATGNEYGRYYAKDGPGLYVERRNPLGGNGSNANKTGEYWIVHTSDGTTYRLGYTHNSEQVLHLTPYDPAHPEWFAPYAGKEKEFAAYRWRVDLITDTHGNKIQYTYDEIMGEGAMHYKREVASYLAQIEYNYAPNGVAATIIAFNTKTQESSGAPIFQNKKLLTSISITHTNQLIRKYQFEYSGPTTDHHGVQEKLLRSIQMMADESALPTTTFTYQAYDNKATNWWASPFEQEAFKYDRLTTVENGYGGRTEITYESDGRFANNAWHAASYRVSQIRTFDRPNSLAIMTTTYAYTAPCYNETGADQITLPAGGTYCPDEEANRRWWGPGSLVGHALVTVTNWTQGQVVNIEEHRFNTTGNLAIRGRPTLVTLLDPQQVELQRTVNTWATLTNGPTTFTYLQRQNSIQYTNDKRSLETKVEYEYYASPLYGNIKLVKDYGDINTDADDRTTYYEYAINSNTDVWIVSKSSQEQVFAGIVTDPAGHTPLSRKRYYYDGSTTLGTQPNKGDLTQVIAGDGPVTATTQTLYDAYGLPVQVTDARGSVVTTTYDALYHLYPVETCSGVGTAVRQCSQTRYYGMPDAPATGGLPGQVWQVIDANGAATSSTYDAFGRLLTVTRPESEGPSLSYTYYDTMQPFHVRVSADAGNGQTLNSHLFFDGLGRQIQTRHDAVDPATGQKNQAVQTTVYDGRGLAIRTYQPVFESVAEAYQSPKVEYLYTATAYDALGRTIVVTQTDGTVLRTFYDGRQVTAVDANNHQTVSIYDARGQLIRVQEYTGTYPSAALYATTLYQYDVLGNLKVVTDTTDLNVTTMTYDILGRKIAMSDPDMGDWVYQYDAAGNLIKQTDARGYELHFVYDPLGRLIRKEENKGEGNKVLAVYGYDQGTNGIGRRTAMTDTAGTVSYVYDTRGRLTSSTRSIAGVGDYTLAYTYDLLDRVVSMTYPDGEVVTTTYNAGGLANGLNSSLGVDYVSDIVYNQMGQIDLIGFGNGVQTDYVYRADNFRLDTIRVYQDANDLLRLAYTYDPAGNILQIADATNDGQVQTFTYDPLDRLTHARTNEMGNGQYNETYAYNEIGNLTVKAGVVYTYPVAGQPRPHAVTGLSDGSSYTYDENGNMIVRVEEGTIYTQEFNVENRLAVVTATHGSVITVTRFIYDGDGTRVAKVTEDGITVYIGEMYEEFIPGLDDWQEQQVVASQIDTMFFYAVQEIKGRIEPFVQESNVLPVKNGRSVLLKPLYSTASVSEEDLEQVACAESAFMRCIAYEISLHYPNGTGLPLDIVVNRATVTTWLTGTTFDGRPCSAYGTKVVTFTGGAVLDGYVNADGCTLNAIISLPGWHNCSFARLIPTNLPVEPVPPNPRVKERELRVMALMTHDTPDAQITQIAPVSPQPIGSNVSVTAWTRHYLGVNEIRYYINSATDGSSSGDWHQFATQTCDGAIECTKTATLNWATVPCTIPRDGTHLIVINVLSSSGEWLYWNQSATRQKTYQWTVPAPVATAEPAYTQGTSNNIGWSAVSGQGCSMYYRVQYANNSSFTNPSYSAWTSITNTTISGLADGVRYYYRVQASPSQNASIASAWSNTVTSTQDASVPTPTMQSEPAYTSGTSNTVAWNAVTDGGVGNVKYQVQRATNSTFTTNVTTTAWQPGTSYLFSGLSGTCQPYYYHVRSQDGLGNTSDWSNIVSSTQDDGLPTGSVTINGGAQWTNSPTVMLSLPANDGCSGVNQMRIWNGEQTEPTSWQTYTTSLTWSLLMEDGERTIRVRFRDAAGNVSVLASDTISLDQRLPTIGSGNFYVNGNGYTNQPTVTLTIAASDVGSGVSQVCFANAAGPCSAWQGFNGAQTSFTHTLTAGDGLKTVYAWVRDAAGNVSAAASDTITLDTTPPALVVNGPANGAAVGSASVHVWGTSELGATIVIHAAPGDVTDTITILEESITFTKWLDNALHAGVNSLTITATDRAGNTTVVTREVTLDTTGPGLTDPMPQGVVGEARPTISASFAEPVDPAKVEIYLDGLPLSTAVVTANGFTYHPPADLAARTYTVTVKLYDTVGNKTESQWSFTVDLSTWVSIGVPEMVNVSPISVTVDGEAGATVTLTVDSTLYGPQVLDDDGKTTFTGVALTEGEHTLAVTATDSLNHTATDTARVTFDPNLPQPLLDISPQRFAPQGQQNHTRLALEANPPAGETNIAWRLDVFATASGLLVTTTGGVALPAEVVWDGRDGNGSFVPGGAYTCTLTVTASNGLAGAVNGTVWVLDGPPPAPVIETPSAYLTTTLRTMRVAGTAEPGSFVIVMDSYGYITSTTQADDDGEWALERALFGGNNTLYARAANAFGLGPQSNQVTVGLVPNPPLYAPHRALPPTARNGLTVTLSTNAREDWPEDGRPTMWVTATIQPTPHIFALTKVLTAGITATWQTEWQAMGLSDGDYAVSFSGVDQDGYVGGGESSLIIQNPPGAPVFYHPQQPVTRTVSKIQVSGWAKPLTTLRIYDNGTLLLTYPLYDSGDWDAWLTLSDGVHAITATATDNQGQISPPSTPLTVTVDTIAPTTEMATLSPFYDVNTLTLSWSGVDPAPGTGIAGYDLRHQYEAGAWQTPYASLAVTQVTASFDEGQHRFCVLARDMAGNVGVCSAEISTIVDTTSPNADPVSIVASSPYAHASGSTVYYGPGTGSFTVTVTATDTNLMITTSGLDAIAFPATVSGGAGYSQYGALTATVTHVYTFDAGDTASGAYNIAVTDRATNQTSVPFTVTRDAVAPTVILTLPERIAASAIPVQWSAVDLGSGVQHYDVEYQIASGDWTPWFTATTQTQATFSGTQGVAYTFRVRATDNVSNTSAWAQAEAKTVVVKKYYTVADQRVAMRENGVLYYLHTDHLGSASLTTDASGTIHAQQRYFPYGETRWSSGTLPTDRQYTGQRNETTLGIYDYKARFYSPRLGRFLSADTVVPGVESQHLNRYMYVEGNPVRYNDPTGHARPTEESENYNYTGTGPYPGLPGWYEAGRAYQSYLEARYKYANRPDIVAGRKETFEMYRSRARMAMPQVLWTEDNVASLYDTAGMTGIGLAASLSGGPEQSGVGGIPESLRQDVIGNRSVVDIAGKTPFRPTQKAVDASYVERFAQSMRTKKFDWGSMRDKIQIVRAQNGMFILEGHHRVLAAQLAGVEIPDCAIKYVYIEGNWESQVSGWEYVEWSGY